MRRLTISDIAAALDDCAHSSRQTQKGEILRQLFAKCKGDAVVTEQLLRILLPSHDRKHVYGMKAQRLIQLITSSSQNVRYEPSPILSSDLDSYYYYYKYDKDEEEDEEEEEKAPRDRTSSTRKTTNIVCMPEFFIATAALARRGGGGGHANNATTSLSALADICDQLTRAYVQSESYHNSMLQVDALQRSILTDNPQISSFDFTEWVLLARLILKRVTMGVGPATVMAALPLANAAPLWARQNDFKVLAEATAAAEEGRTEVKCGVPFVPMSCDSMRSPYLLKWLFSREELLEKPLTPIDGRLYMRDEAHWYVPLTSQAPNNLRLVNLDDDRVLHLRSKVRSRHLRLLRMFKRAKMLVAANAVGLLIHYTLSVDNEKLAILLVRDVSDATESGVELAEDGGGLPASVLAEEEEEEEEENDPEQQEDEAEGEQRRTRRKKKKKASTSDKRRKELLNALLAQQQDHEEGQSEVRYVGKQALKILVATSRAPLNRRRPPAAAAVAAANPPLQPQQQQQNNIAAPSNQTRQNTAKRVAKQVASSVMNTWPERLRLRNQAPNNGQSSVPQQANNTNNNRAKQGRTKKANHDAEVKKDGIIAQVKYDGDRLQAHVISASEVKLFTRWGVDVTGLYSNISDALKELMHDRAEFPCILDGELVVVDNDGAPLPWSSEKWKYNHRNVDGEADSLPLSSLLEDVNDDLEVIALENEDLAFRPAEDCDDDVISFISRPFSPRYCGYA